MTSKSAGQWPGHVLLANPVGPQAITMDSNLLTWNDTALAHEPLYDTPNHTGVDVSITDPITGTTANFTTDQNGRIYGAVSVVLGRDYDITFKIAGKTFGSRVYGSHWKFRTKAVKRLGAISLLEKVHFVPDIVYTSYAGLINADDAATVLDFYAFKLDAIREFEDNYSKTDTNFIVEGDSWFDDPHRAGDIYTFTKDYLTKATKKPAKFLPLQRWGHTSGKMFDGGEHYITFLLEYLQRYDFKVMLLSAGGNDFALSIMDYLRPSLSPTLIQDVKAMGSGLDFDLTGSYGVIAQHVLGVVGNSFEHIKFPDLVSNPAPLEQVVASVFQEKAVDDAFIAIRLRLMDLMAAMNQRSIGTTIFAHTYAYPIFSGSSGMDFWNGPHMAKAFSGAQVNNMVLRTLCIKALVDSFRVQVLEPVSVAFPLRFAYADLRKFAQHQWWWNDEMHPNVGGYKYLADQYYYALRGFYPTLLKPI